MKRTLLASSIVCLLSSTSAYSNDYIVVDESNPSNELLLSKLERPANFSLLLEEDTFVDVMFFFQNSYVDLLGQQVAHTRITEWVGAINAIAEEQEMGFQLRITNALVSPSISDELFLEDDLDDDGGIEVVGASTLFFNAVFNEDIGPLPEFDIYNAYGSDIAIYVREFRESDDIANVLGRAQFGGAVNMIFDRFTGTPGFSERIFDLVFTHEMGHNLGGGHEVDIDDNPPFAEVDAHAATCGGQNTIMFSSLGTTNLTSFSDPELMNDGDFCGEEGVVDNRRVLIENAVMTSTRGEAAVSAGQFNFTSAEFTTSEFDGTAAVSVIRDGDLSQTAEVEIALFDGSAQQGSDFVEGIARATFEAGEATATVDLDIIQDALSEGDEQVNMILRYPLRGELGALASSNLNIVDGISGDVGVIGVTGQTTLEEGQDVVLTLTRSQGSDGELVVNVSTTDQSAFIAQDYQAFNESIIFADGEISQTITIDTVDDNLSELTETFIVQVTSDQTTVNQGVQQVTLVDNEEAAGQFNVSVSAQAVNENDGSLDIIIDRVNGTVGEANISVSTSGGGNSIVPINQVVNFADGETQQTVPVTINDDTTEEIDQVITVTIEAVDDENVATSFVTFTVFDNDGDNDSGGSSGGGGSAGFWGLLVTSLALFRRRLRRS